MSELLTDAEWLAWHDVRVHADRSYREPELFDKARGVLAVAAVLAVTVYVLQHDEPEPWLKFGCGWAAASCYFSQSSESRCAGSTQTHRLK